MKTRAGGLIAAVLIAVAGVFILQKATFKRRCVKTGTFL